MKYLLVKFLMIPVFLVPIFFALVSCDKIPGMLGEMKDDDAKAKAALVGVWRGDGSYEGEENKGWSESWKMVRDANGRYKVDYLIVHDGQKLYELSSDAGTWSYNDGAYHEVNSNGDKTSYNVFSVKKDWFEYNIAARDGTANIQESKTVDTFQLQDPPKNYQEVSYDQPAEAVE